MNDYDFKSLNDKEFESFTIELLSLHFGTHIERFKSGKDKGVDGRFYLAESNEVILQCKHYAVSGYKSLLSSIKTTEIDKVKKLNPSRYIFITSVPLSRKNKKEIADMFKPYILRDDDVYGKEDINVLLNKFPELEEKYYKLWIASTSVLKRIFNSAIKGRSKFLLEEIYSKSNKYVRTESHEEIVALLEKVHTAIISGEPGIGKTTLAENVCLEYVAKGYELCVIEGDLTEAEGIYDDTGKQIFYFDDFLGSNYLAALSPHEDSHIVRFISRIGKDKNKRFVLTTRTNILNQGYSLSDKFKSYNIKENEYLINIEDLSDLDKAKILYNHIWFGNLDENIIDQIYKDKRYRVIINHNNYNPRLIQFITNKTRIESVAVNEYWKFVQSILDNPVDVWENFFEKQCDEYIRNIVLVVTLNSGKMNEEDLSRTYDRLNELMNLGVGDYSSKNFASIIKIVVGSLLNRTISNSKISYSLFNPSIADYIFNLYSSDFNKLSKAFLSIRTIASLSVMVNLYKSNIISKKIYVDLLKFLYLHTDIRRDYSVKYCEYLYYLFAVNNLYGSIDINDSLSWFLKESFNGHLDVYDTYRMVYMVSHLYDRSMISYPSDILIKKVADASVAGVEDLDALIYFIEKFDRDNKYVNDVISEGLYNFLTEELENNRFDIDPDAIDLDVQGSDEFGVDFTYDEDMLRQELELVLDSSIRDFSNDISGYIDTYDIVSYIDFDEVVQKFVDDMLEEPNDDEYRPIGYSDDYGSSIDAIDDLFSKD